MPGAPVFSHGYKDVGQEPDKTQAEAPKILAATFPKNAKFSIGHPQQAGRLPSPQLPGHICPP